MWRFDYLGALISELTWREGGCKDNNKDISWENLMQLGDQIKALWIERRQEWQNSEEPRKQVLIKSAETELIQFLKNLLLSDLQKLKLRLSRVLMKEHFRFLNNSSAHLFFSLERPESLVYGNRTKEVLEDDRNPKWYEGCRFVKNIFFPDQNGNAAVVFKKENAKAVAGLPNIRAFSEPRLDRDCIRSMLRVLTDLKIIKPDTQQGKEAILMACQALGEYSHCLSDSFKKNLVQLANSFPFKALRETRNAIKLAVSHQHRFQYLDGTLGDSDANDQLYQRIRKELLSLKASLSAMLAGMNPYISDNFTKAPLRNWIVANNQMYQADPVQVEHLDVNKPEILSIFDQLSTGLSGALQKKAQDARIFLKHILCNHVPFIEIKNERQKVVNQLKRLVEVMSEDQFSKGDNSHKKQVYESKKKMFKLLDTKILNTTQIPLTHVVTGANMVELEKFYTRLNRATSGPRLNERDYVDSYMKLTLASIKTVSDLIKNLHGKGISLDEIGQRLDEDPNLNYAIRFHVTVIGQSIRSLEKTDLFVANASEDLLAELYSFRWVRNNEMHNMDQPIGESLLRWYNEKVNLEGSRHQASEIATYVVYLERLLTQLKGNFDENRQTNSEPFLIASVQNDLRRSVEKSGITYMYASDILWLYRDQLSMIWNFLLPFITPNLDLVLFAEERPALEPSQPGLYLYKHQERAQRTTSSMTIVLEPKKRPENEWTCLVVYSSVNSYEFKLQKYEIEHILGYPLNTFAQVDGKIVLSQLLMIQLRLALLLKEHLRSPVAYLLSERLETSSWVTLRDLYVNRKSLDKAAYDEKLTIKGIDDGPMGDQWDAPLKIGVVSKQTSSPEQKERLARFRRACNRILGANVNVVDDLQFQPGFNLTDVANSYYLFKYMQYVRPSLKELKQFFDTHQGKVDVNFYVEGYTVLHTIKRNYGRAHYIEIAKYLIGKQGAEPTLLDKHGDTVLHRAAAEGDVGYCRFLLNEDGRGDPNQESRKGKLAVEVAAEQQRTEIVDLLLPLTNVTSKQRLMIAINLCSVDMAREALKTDPAIVSGLDKFGEIPIVKTAQMGHLPMLKVLVAFGASPKETFEGNTLLHIHCMSNYPKNEFIQYLVKDCGVLADARNYQDSTALHYASACHHLGLTKQLLRLSANPALVNDSGETPLHKVAQCVRMDEDALTIAKLLIESGTPLRQQDNFAGTILHLAALNDHQKLAEVVLAKDPGLSDVPSQGHFCRGELPLKYNANESVRNTRAKTENSNNPGNNSESGNSSSKDMIHAFNSIEDVKTVSTTKEKSATVSNPIKHPKTVLTETSSKWSVLPIWAKVMLVIGCVLVAPVFVPIVLGLNLKKIDAYSSGKIPAKTYIAKTPVSGKFKKSSSKTVTSDTGTQARFSINNRVASPRNF